MKITSLCIRNFKSIKELRIDEADDALILVGRNNTGKSIVLDAIRMVAGDYEPKRENFYDDQKNISVEVSLKISEEDLKHLHSKGIVSKYKNYALWLKEFSSRLPSYQNGILSFEYIYGTNGSVKYRDGYKKNNQYIKAVFPKIYFIDHLRSSNHIQEEILMLQGNSPIAEFKENPCIFDKAKKCNQCFECIGLINKKTPDQLTVLESARLFEYKIFETNLNKFADKLNRYFYKNGGISQEISYRLHFDLDEMFKIETIVKNKERDIEGNIMLLGEGLKSIYLLSLLEAYIDEKNVIPYIIMIEDPEIYLHPQLQKVASEILYRLSKKNQVIFCTHSPTMIFNFTSRQIRQIVVDKEYNTTVNEETDIDEILDDLGYTANDLMNVNFVFIVEGKQDKSRLPLLLNKYYSEIIQDGKLQRIAIIATNSCTNIKTYANLKYINKLYLKDQFLMIRDSDGKDREMLKKQLCSYYHDRAREDVGNIPRVTDKNVLILKYYSFENYFLCPEVMAQIGVVKSVDDFYDILYAKYREYLYKLSSMRRMQEKLKIRINSRQDIIDNMENIKIYVRGHNLYDIFYGRYKGEREIQILQKYIDAAPREAFKDILEAVDKFVYFDNRIINI